MKELIRQMVAALVDHPEQIHLHEVQSENSVLFEVQVAPGELGKVIGRHGQMIQALRIIVTAAGMKLRKQARLELLENSTNSDSAAVG